MKLIYDVKKYYYFMIILISGLLILSTSDVVFAKSSLRCFSCGETISGNHILTENLRFHPECFICKKCGGKITADYHLSGKDLYHPRCYKLVNGLICDHCKKILDDNWVESDGLKYHKNCYSKHIQARCAICQKPITGNFKQDADGSYHADCYRSHKLEKCIVCSEPIEGRFLSDLWGNSSHKTHNGIQPDFCGSCGRIISERASDGGFKLSDGRIICGFCNTKAITTQEQVTRQILKVRKILAFAGLRIPKNIPVHLVDQDQLSKEAGSIYSENTKGFTNSKTALLGTTIISVEHKIFLLHSLPETEFMGVLSHEFIHVWLNERGIKMSPPETEGFCNLGTMLVNTSISNPLAKVLMLNMEKNPDPVYGEGYREMKKQLDHYGWKNLIKKISG